LIRGLLHHEVGAGVVNYACLIVLAEADHALSIINASDHLALVVFVHDPNLLAAQLSLSLACLHHDASLRAHIIERPCYARFVHPLHHVACL